MDIDRPTIVRAYAQLMVGECGGSCALQLGSQGGHGASDEEKGMTEISYQLRLVQSAYMLVLDWFKEAIGRRNASSAVTLGAFVLDDFMQVSTDLLTQVQSRVRKEGGSAERAYGPVCKDLLGEQRRIRILEKQFQG